MRARRRRSRAVREATPFASERALCEQLRESATALGWIFYPEQGGWDALLVLEDETQIGVQAKLRPSVDVLAQCIVPPRSIGPDVHAVLVPSFSSAFLDVAEALGIMALSGHALRLDGESLHQRLRRSTLLEDLLARAPRTTHLPGRCWLPPYVPSGPAGVPSPSPVTAWRVAAAHLCAEIRAGLEPTNAEITSRGMTPSTWRRWLDPIPETRPRRYRLRPGYSLPDVAFPDVCAGLRLPPPERAL